MSTMQQALVLVSVLAVVLQMHAAPPPKPAFFAKCMADNHVTPADFKNFAKTGEASDNLKCNFKCIMMEGGMLSEDGKINPEPMLQHTPEKIHDVVKECSKIEASADLCDVAYRQHKCVRDKATEWFQEMAEAHDKQ